MMEDVQRETKHFADYLIVEGQLYRHFARQVNDEDITPWKLCVSQPLRGQMLQQSYSEPSDDAGHLNICSELRHMPA